MPETIGSRLSEVLVDQKLSQSILAKRIGASQSFISAVMRDAKIPGGEILLLLKEALGVNLHWLLTGEGPRYGISYVEMDFFQNLILQWELAARAGHPDDAWAAHLFGIAQPLLAPESASKPASGNAEAYIEDALRQHSLAQTVLTAVNERISRLPNDQRDDEITRSLRAFGQKGRPNLIDRLVSESAKAASQKEPSHVSLKVTNGDVRKAGRDYYERRGKSAERKGSDDGT